MFYGIFTLYGNGTGTGKGNGAGRIGGNNGSWSLSLSRTSVNMILYFVFSSCTSPGPAVDHQCESTNRIQLPKIRILLFVLARCPGQRQYISE